MHDSYLLLPTSYQTDGHPLAEDMAARIKGIIVRAKRGKRSKPTDSWLQMASADGECFYVDMRTGFRYPDFPVRSRILP